MPLIHEDAPTTHGPRVSIRPSIVIEIEWVLASAGRDDYRLDHAAVAAVYEARPELQERVHAIWSHDDALSHDNHFLELMVLAHQGGLLFTTDADALLGRLDELCATSPVVELPLLSETAETRAGVVLRLAALRDSAELRGRYVALVGDVWDAIRAEWELVGRGAVDGAVAARHELQAKGADWHEVARGECDFGGLLDSSVAALGPDGEIVVVPAYFTHKGLFVDLPGVVVVGVRTDTTGAQARARTESLARRLKAISDPTRLAILDALRGGPRTVTEVAAAFCLAQPTVSNHVKILRDAGLVVDVRQGTRRSLVVQYDVVDELITNLHDALSDRSPERSLAPARAAG